MSNLENDEKETGRVEAFSDGVFSVAITLLVLDFKVPPASGLTGAHMTLEEALVRQWPIDLAYLISFATVLIMWTNHHAVFKHIRRTDRPFLLLNGLLLMLVTVVPFSTSLLAEHMPQPYAKTAAAVYSGWFILIALAFNLLWHYAANGKRLLAKNHDAGAVSSITQQYRFGPALYAVAFGLAFVSALASVGACLMLAVFFAFPGRKKAGKI